MESYGCKYVTSASAERCYTNGVKWVLKMGFQPNKCYVKMVYFQVLRSLKNNTQAEQHIAVFIPGHLLAQIAAF